MRNCIIKIWNEVLDFLIVWDVEGGQKQILKFLLIVHGCNSKSWNDLGYPKVLKKNWKYAN